MPLDMATIFDDPNWMFLRFDESDAAVIRFGRQMLSDKKVDSATFAKVAQLLGRRGAMDLVAVMNTYAVSGFYALAVDEHMPPGRADLR